MGAYAGLGRTHLERFARCFPFRDVRWRLSSLEPTEVSRELLQLMADNANFCPHLHLPLQSGHDEILKKMNRPYTTAEYLAIIRLAREFVPGICITTDIMVGFPGETEEHFRAYLEFVNEVEFSDLHVFPYSPRRGTPAATLPDQVDAKRKEERSHIFILAKDLAKKYATKFLGRTLEVLVETNLKDDIWEGHSANYLRLEFQHTVEHRGSIIPVVLCAINENSLIGEPQKEV